MSNERYLGDGVYAEIKNGVIVLSARDGAGIQAEIWLELSVGVALMDYLKTHIQVVDFPRPDTTDTVPAFTRELTQEEIDTLLNEGKGLGFDFDKEEK